MDPILIFLGLMLGLVIGLLWAVHTGVIPPAKQSEPKLNVDQVAAVQEFQAEIHKVTDNWERDAYRWRAAYTHLAARFMNRPPLEMTELLFDRLNGRPIPGEDKAA